MSGVLLIALTNERWRSLELWGTFSSGSMDLHQIVDNLAEV